MSKIHLKNHYSTKFLIFFFLVISACSSKVDPVTGEKIIIETDVKKKAEQSAREGGGIFGDITGNKNKNTFDFATSNPLWRATLKSLEFLPLASADYAGGIIIYDWYSENINSAEQIKVSIRFLSTETRASSIEVLAYKRICDSTGKCVISKIDNSTSNDIKEKIILTARAILLEEAKKEKNK